MADGVYMFDQMPGQMWKKPAMPDMPTDRMWLCQVVFRDGVPSLAVTVDDVTTEYPMVPFVPLGW